MKNWDKMYYRIRFKAAPKEFVFEAIKHFVLVKDVILTIKKNFKLLRDDLHVYSDEGIRLQPEDHAENGRTYVIKRVPSRNVRYSRNRTLK